LLPVEILINEHRLIERFIKIVKKETENIIETQKVKSNFIVIAVDFFRTYADRYHHGKEEGILFQGLSQKKLSESDKKIMLELTMEHAYARRTVKNLEGSKELYLAGNFDALKDILILLKALVELYPAHIEKEDKHFFLPSMEYFSLQEQAEMLSAFVEFDREFTNNKYQQVISTIETKT
jgi:hemerythrin-like domain-containing protein